MLNGRSADSTPSSLGSLWKSPACHGVSMWMIELATKIRTADTSAGMSRAVTLIIEFLTSVRLKPDATCLLKPAATGLRPPIAAVEFRHHRRQLVRQRRAAASEASAPPGPDEHAVLVHRQPGGVAA